MTINYLAGLAFVFGLNLPKSFSLLYIALLFFYFQRLRANAYKWGTLPAPVLITSSLLLIFGSLYSTMQAVNAVWIPVPSYLPEILAISVLPCACLLAGYLSPINLSDISRLILFFSLGSLTYALLSILISHHPWYNFLEVFPHVLRVPWGEKEFLSTRAVEQRAFLLMCLAPVFLKNCTKKLSRSFIYLVIFLLLEVAGFYVVYSTNTRLIFPALILSLIPLVCLFKSTITKYMIIFSLAFLILISVVTGRICDERLWLQFEFIRHASQSLTGGRQIIFRYRDCVPNGFNNFGSFEGSSAFSPHNVFLDVYNDAGIVPFIAFLLAFIIIISRYIQKMQTEYSVRGSSLSQLYTLWGFTAVYFTQLVLQPFMYTDQLFFTLGIFVLGWSLQESKI